MAVLGMVFGFLVFWFFGFLVFWFFGFLVLFIFTGGVCKQHNFFAIIPRVEMNKFSI